MIFSSEYLASGLRAQIHKNNEIYYRHADTEVIITHVVHGARDPAA